MTVIKNRAGFAEHAAPEAVAAYLKTARDRAARANAEVQWLENLLAEKVGKPLCPCCGLHPAVEPYDVCTGCAAALGWNPPCEACTAEGKGHADHGLAHGTTCMPGIEEAG